MRARERESAMLVDMQVEREKTTKLKYETFFLLLLLSHFFTHTHLTIVRMEREREETVLVHSMQLTAFMLNKTSRKRRN